MFFSSVLFTKRGNLSKIWLAAHHQDKRLTKAVVVSTNIEECSHELSEPAVPLSLRISGQLLLGVVRIYQRKVRYLQEDTQEALTKVRMSCRPRLGAIELHPSNATAVSSHITFVDATDNDFLDFAIPDIPLNQLEEMCDEDLNQQEFALAHDATLEDEDHFSYGFGVDHGANQLKEVNDVLGVGEEEDVIEIEPFEQIGGKADDSIEIGRDIQDFAIDDAFYPVDVGAVDESTKVDNLGSVVPVVDFDMIDEPFPMLEQNDDVISVVENENDRSILGSVDVAPELNAEINIAVKKNRKRKRIRLDRATQLPSTEIMDQDTSKMLLERTRFLEPEPISAPTSGDFPRILLMPSELIGPLSVDLTALFMHSYQKGSMEAVVENAEQSAAQEEDVASQCDEAPLHQTELEGVLNSYYEDDLPASCMDDAVVVQTLEDSVADDNDQRQFEESFISIHPLTPDVLQEQEQKDDDATQPDALSTWSDRTKKMCALLSEWLDNADAEIKLHSLIEGKSRSMAAVIFLETLILKSYDFIKLEQSQPYGEISIQRASRFRDSAAMVDITAITG